MNKTEDLIAKSQAGDAAATEALVNENKGLIWSVARRYLGRGTEADDLYQLGCLGFLKAVDGFDISFGTQFSTYAVPKIAGEIRRFLRDDGSIKVSRSIKEQATTIKQAQYQLSLTLGREPSVEEISKATGLTSEEIAIAQSATSATESIQRETGENGFSLESILADEETEEKMLEKVALRQAIARLSSREAMVIHLRFFHGLTQEKAARVLHVSQVQVSRIEKKALNHLRELMRDG